MRRTPLLAMLVGVVLLAAGLLITANAVAQGREQHKSLQRDAAQVASSFSSYFERARSLDLLLAQNPSLARAGQGSVDFEEANQALRYLETLYPGAIGEACLINEQGVELARVTEGVSAPASDLSSNEASNGFFAKTLELEPGQVYQAPPYISADTKHWVISNSTWIRRADGSRLIVHFEVSLKSFTPYVTSRAASSHVAVIDRSLGRIILQDRAALPPATASGRFPVTAWSAEFASKSATADPPAVDGHQVAIQTVDRAAGNANDWAVAEWTTARASLLPAWVGGSATAVGLVLILLAVVMIRRQQSTLRAAARLDHLTGLANRKALEEALDEALQATTRADRDRVAVLMLDLDGFKQINDSLGHDKGDVVLQEIARRLHANVFEYDTAARMGGDEFAVVLRRLREVDDVAVVAHRLREALVRPIEIDGRPRFIGASVGAAVHLDHGRTSVELLRAADAAMFQAKRGREGVRVYDAGTAAGASAAGLAAELMAAIEADQIELAFQPEYSLTTDAVIGVEALARWHRPGHGPVPPMEFIPLAEETGLIRSLTYLTLRRALDEAASWHASGLRIPVSVNLSGQMATDRSLPTEVSALIEERGLTGEALILEITETALINDRKGAVEVLQRLRALGVRVELDDFGSGYASFKALHDLPLDGVKIDRDLVTDQTHEEPRLLAATIEIAQRLGLHIVAEGIEDAATLDVVRRLGCDTAQGYHLGRPMTPESIRLLLGEAQPAPAIPTLQS